MIAFFIIITVVCIILLYIVLKSHISQICKSNINTFVCKCNLHVEMSMNIKGILLDFGNEELSSSLESDELMDTIFMSLLGV